MYLVLPTWKIILTKYIIKHSYYVVHENLSKLRTYTHKQFKMQIRAMNVSEKSFSR